MRAILLIARREYLSYVGTWGFWLSLLECRPSPPSVRACPP